MNEKKLVDDVIEYMGASVGESERAAIITTLKAGSNYGYGNLIAWLATAWAAALREKDGIDADPEDFAGGRCYPLPPFVKSAHPTSKPPK